VQRIPREARTQQVLPFLIHRKSSHQVFPLRTSPSPRISHLRSPFVKLCDKPNNKNSKDSRSLGPDKTKWPHFILRTFEMFYFTPNIQIGRRKGTKSQTANWLHRHWLRPVWNAFTDHVQTENVSRSGGCLVLDRDLRRKPIHPTRKHGTASSSLPRCAGAYTLTGFCDAVDLS
jgi:hypothetical protein